MRKIALSLLLMAIGLIAFAQMAPDDDNDGVPNDEDVCPSVKGTKTNKGCPVIISETTAFIGELSEQDKKTFIANFQKVLSHIPTKFQKLKTGEEDWDITSRISWFKSNLQLFPNHTDKSKTQLMYGTYNGKPVIAFIENAPVDVNTIVTILMPVLKAKGMVEVNTKFIVDDPTARSFRSKDAVVQINSVKSTGGSSLSIGKIPYYYESDVKPMTATNPKPVVVTAKTEIIELKQAIIRVNEAIKKNKSNPFFKFSKTNSGKNSVFPQAKECVWQVKTMFNTVVTDANEICIQATAASGEQLAKIYSNPCLQLRRELGGAYKELINNGDSYIANYENVSITYAITEGPNFTFAPLIYIRPRNIADNPIVEKPASKSSGSFIEPVIFEDIMEAICENSVYLKIKGKIQPEDNKEYETSFVLSGPLNNLPAYYNQKNRHAFKVKIGLSDNVKDLDKAAEYINNLFAKTNACNKTYRTFKLAFDATTGKYADVSAWDDGGMFVYIEKENGLVQLRINKINYTEEEKKIINKPSQSIVNNPCNDIEIILKECVLGFKNVKGSFVKKETPAEYYSTTLPALGFKDKFVVESKNIEFENGNMIRKNIIYYDAMQDFSSNNDALSKYEEIKSLIKKCFSGTVNVSDENNQKIYEFFTDYKGYNIRIALIYLNLFGSISVSVTVRIND